MSLGREVSGLRPGETDIDGDGVRCTTFGCTCKNQNPESWVTSSRNEGLQNIFGGHLKTYLKMLKKLQNAFRNRYQNSLRNFFKKYLLSSVSGMG